MRKAVGFLALSFLLSFTSAFAAFQGPANFQGKYEASQDAIQLNWQNVENYSQQTLTKVSSPSGGSRVLKDQPNPATGQQTFSDTNQGQEFARGAYQYQLSTTKGGEIQTSDLSVPIMPEDSNIVIVKTTTGGPPAVEGYILTCLGSTTSTISLAWSGNVSGTHTLNLYRSTSASGVLGGSRTLVAPPPTLTTGSGSYTDATGLAENTNYWYRLEWGGSGTTQQCRTAAESPPPTPAGADVPSFLNVWALSPSSLYVNWKDNSVVAHTFDLQRVKLTPAPPVFPYTDATGKKGVETVSDTAIKLYWKNLTNTQTLKGPYYHLVERSTSSTPFADPDNDGDLDEHDPSFTKIPWAFTDDVDVASTRTIYEQTSTGLTEGTNYYYRMKGCSFVRADVTREQPPPGPQNDVPEDICGAYQSGGVVYLATTTLPASPQGVEFTNVTTSSLALRWKDYSQRESGFALAVFPAPGAGNCTTGQCTAPVNAAMPPAGQTYSFTAPFTVTGLQPGTSYAVAIRAFRDGTWGRAFSPGVSPSNSTTTDSYVMVASPDGGTIGGDCTSGQTCYFSYGHSVTLTASASGEYEFTQWTGGPCTNSTNATCTFPITGNVSVNALFTENPKVVVASPSGGTIGGDCESGKTCYFVPNTSVTLTATADGGYEFTKWNDGPCNNSTNATCTFPITGNVTVNALFTRVVLQETVSVNAFVGATATSTAFNFSLVDPNGKTVASGVNNVPTSTTANYPTGSDKKFTFTYVSGGPPGMVFEKIVHLNSTGSGAPTFNTFTGQGFIGEDGGWLKYDVYFTTASGMLPTRNLYANVTESLRTVIEWFSAVGTRVRVGATALAGDFAAAVRGLFATAAASVELRTVGGVTLTRDQLDAYFDRFTPSGWQGSHAERNLSVFTDTGLAADTAYLYRVRACSGGTCTVYSDAAAGKTLSGSAVESGVVKVCVRNNFCGTKTRYIVPGSSPLIASDDQCALNIHCRDVGTSRQFFEETR
ncbi:MAG: hypothetical protein V1696_01270 [Candidatus Jorgensenbacteria bacterium]